MVRLTVPYATPDDIDYMIDHLDHCNTRVVNVRQPWASLLFCVKDVENRSVWLPANSAMDPHCCVLVVASKTASLSAKTFNDGVADARLRFEKTMKASGITDDYQLLQHQKAHVPDNKIFYSDVSQHVIGMIKFRSRANFTEDFAESDSVWNNNDAYAWCVASAVKFRTPFHFGNGSLGLVKLNGDNRNNRNNSSNLAYLKRHALQELHIAQSASASSSE